MTDRVFEGFLRTQQEAVRQLETAGAMVALLPLGAPLPDRYRVRFHGRGLVRDAGGAVREADGFEVGIRFPPDYLRRVNPMQVLTWLGPRAVWHPNISDRLPFMCIGGIRPGTPLVSLLERCHQVITYQKVTTALDNTLNPEAARWAAVETVRFPVDPRPWRSA